ncbi:hypothetical protein [Adhaeribacter rhizoryzae]|nr:hypothetical protein [Adhaeribacter rhizoryzae]
MAGKALVIKPGKSLTVATACFRLIIRGRCWHAARPYQVPIDLYEIEAVFKQLCNLLKEEGVETEGLFLNADAGFDSAEFRSLCAEMKIEANIAFNPRNGNPPDDYVYFDEQLFKRRNTIERANAWLDSFKALLVRFETKALHWFNLQLLAFTLLFIRKINKLKL